MHAGDFSYTTANGQITITGYTGSGDTVTIPGTIDALPVTHIGDSAFYCTNVTSIEIPSGVVSIGKSAFTSCGNLTSVTLPSTLTSIGDSAFYYNVKMTRVNIPAGLLSLGKEVFSDCTALTEITIPASVTSMGTGMFKRCTALTSATVLASVTNIGTNAFQGCTSLTSVTLPPSLASLPNYLFSGCYNLTSVTIPPGVTSIGQGAFDGCHLLPGITIPAGVTDIGNYAFRSCRSLTNLTLLGGVQTVGHYAFSGCWKLAGVNFPAGLTSIGDYAFSYCSALTNVTLPAGLTSIGEYAFSYCSVLANVTLPAGVTRIDNSAFVSCPVLGDVSIPASVTFIGSAAFARCTGISNFTVEETNPNYRSVDGVLYNKSMTILMTYPGARAGSFIIPDSVTTIETMAFSICGKLTGVTMPSNLTGISEAAFSYCPLLENVTIPASVTSIGPNAFHYCGKLSGAYFPGNAPFLGLSAFDSTAPGFTVFYHQAGTGFTSPLWRGYPATALSANQEITLKGPLGETLVDDASETDFGYLLPGGSSSKTFTISNSGSIPLAGLSLSVDGNAAAGFTVSTLATPVLAPGSCTTFTVTFSPAAGGNKTAALHVVSDDADESPFDIHLSGICTATPTPEITVKQDAILLEDGTAVMQTGSTAIGTFVVSGITITNSGTGDMQGLAITLDGADAADFSFTATPPSVLAPGASFSCIVSFAPKTVGNRSAQIHIASNDPDENPFDITLSGIAKPRPSPEISVESSSGAVLSDGGSVITFEPVPPGEQSANQIYTIRNLGNAYLQNLAITKDGPNAANFFVSNLSTTSLHSGGSTTFAVRFISPAVGTRTATIHIQSNDADENPFDIQLAGFTPGLTPEIEVQDPVGTPMSDGASSTSFGTVSTGSSEARAFSIINNGAAPLTNLAFTVDGEHAADFPVSGPQSTTILPGGIATFTVNFAPGALGDRNARLHIASNDADESPFDIDLSGTGVPPTFPEITVEFPAATNLTDGVSAVSWGTLNMNSMVLKTFTIRNEGTADLLGLQVSVDGPDHHFFSAIPPSVPRLAPGESTTFDVTFQAYEAGSFSAALHVVTNDADENPFDIPISATVLATPPLRSEIDIQQAPGKSLKDGASGVSFGSVKVKSGKVKTFTIRNLGTINLKVNWVTKSGPHAKDFIITPPVGNLLEPGGTMTFKVTFRPSAIGLRKASIRIKNTDSNESPFDIDLTGKGVVNAKTSQALAGSLSSLSAMSHPAPKVSTSRETIHGQAYLTITVPKPPGREFEIPVVEVSSNRVDWYSGPNHTTVIHDGALKLVVRDNTAVSPGNKRHIRIKPTPTPSSPRRR